ncbi:DUF3553 domain-containing protein [Geobacter sp. SVR]|uniref:DUF3553 domain-containing protein n=1 Tax=Geobacter sp. SVR TaxID=2495594 RepID=UPI00143F0038|nr:DUF3553 domain-containing protein [Geobacter sp. SVR]BCS55349.1 hypothetical protein GSVR_36570 [Geobacter sp. SVR]GCF87274.1 hypothetical protein GSbR_38740 [Geobacter sp. SVR]
MTLKVGNIVNHSGMLEWGAGKVLEVTATLAMIQFSDGKNRKIAISHFDILQPALLGSFIPLPEIHDERAVSHPTKVARKKK